MKKFISGIIVGALLFTGASAFADSVSLIGQKVQGLFTVEKAGTKIADAVIINGTAYAPVRAVSEATGTTLTVEGKKIIMGDVVVGDAQPSDKKVDAANELRAQREKAVAEISRLEANIEDLENNVIPMFEAQAKEMSTNGTVADTAKKTAEDYKQVVVKQKTELAFYQAELADINTALGE